LHVPFFAGTKHRHCPAKTMTPESFEFPEPSRRGLLSSNHDRIPRENGRAESVILVIVMLASPVVWSNGIRERFPELRIIRMKWEAQLYNQISGSSSEIKNFIAARELEV